MKPSIKPGVTLGLMISMISLDTNLVLRFLLNDLPEQAKKVENLVLNNQVYVTEVVIIETVYVLEKIFQIPRQDIARLVGDFFNFPNLATNRDFLPEVISLYRDHPALSVVDCYVAIESTTRDNQLATFDKRLASQGGGNIVRI